MGVANHYLSSEWTRPRLSTMIFIIQPALMVIMFLKVVSPKFISRMHDTPVWINSTSLFKIVSNFNVYAYAFNIPGNKFTHYIIIQ